MYTIAYRLHRDGHIEPFTANTMQQTLQPYFTVEDRDGTWFVRGHTSTISADVGASTDQQGAETLGATWLKSLGS